MIRIFSDLHYGDRASTLTRLPSLTPLFDGADRIVLNGDTLDTRPSRYPEATAENKQQASEFFARSAPPTVWLTGNHDPDISDEHSIELADRGVFVTHGDILFENLVPWGRDATALTERVAAELARFPAAQREELPNRFVAYRRAAASIPQRHQAERNALKYAIGFAADTIWPPLRVLDVLRAWREAPIRAEKLLQRYRFPARLFIMGHTHRLGAVATPGGIVVVNTGSFCPPTGAGVVEIDGSVVRLRSVERRANEFRFGPDLRRFELAHSTGAATLRA